MSSTQHLKQLHPGLKCSKNVRSLHKDKDNLKERKAHDHTSVCSAGAVMIQPAVVSIQKLAGFESAELSGWQASEGRVSELRTRACDAHRR